MLNEIKYSFIQENELSKQYGKGVDMGTSLVTTFAIVAIITIVVYKLYNSKSGNITLPGGFKFKFTT